MLHFLREQRGAIDLEHAQHALHLMELIGAALQQADVIGLLDITLEGSTRLAERDIQLAADELERLRCNFSHVRFRWRPRWEARRLGYRPGV